MSLRSWSGGRALAAAALALASPSAATPDPGRAEGVLVLVGAALEPVATPRLEDGVLVVAGGKIVALGQRGQIEIPPGAVVRDLAGKTILPGLVDTHSHITGPGGGDASQALHPEVRVLDGIDVRSDTVRKALAGGITTVNVMPGSGHLMSGQTVYLKLRPGDPDPERWLLCDGGAPPVCGGLKMANGTNSMRSPSPPFPETRGKSAALARKLFVEARGYREKLADGRKGADRRPDRDLGLEILGEVLDGRRIVHFHTHRHDDIATVIRLAGEFGFRPVLHHVSEGWRMAEEIAAAGLPSSVIAIDSPGGKHEAADYSLATPAALFRAGASVSIHTDDGITDSRSLLRSAALAIRAGLPREAALAAVTLEAARMLGLERRVGSLEPGKDADFVVLSGDPFSTWTAVEETWVEGRRVFDRADPEQRTWAVGGYQVYRGEAAGHDSLEGSLGGAE